MTIIKGKGLLLRPIRLSDAQGYLECHLDKEASRNFSRSPKDIADAKASIRKWTAEWKKGARRTFAIEVDKKFAGFISLHDMTTHLSYKHTAIVGYGIHQDFRGRGLATKALKLITKYGFEKLKLVRISGMCRTYNKASARVLEKAGYKHEGTLRKNKFINGKYLDDMVWAKVK